MRSKSLYAALLSFGIYLFPLVGPHTFFLLGELCWRELTRGEREPLWIAAEVGLAMLLQVIAFVGVYYLFKEPTALRIVLFSAAVPLAGIATEFAYLVYIPSIFLIEDDRAPEKGRWAVECSAQEVALIDIAHPAGSFVWSEMLVQAPDGTYKLMRIPGCELIPLEIPRATVQPGGRVDFTTSINYFVPGHGVIFSKQETATGTFTWNHLVNGRITPLPGLHPAAVPILSTDGKWVAWIERESIAIEPIDGDEPPLQVNVGNFNTWSYTLRTVNMQQEEIELVNSDQRIVFGLDGKIKSSAGLPFAWDRYREDGPYRVSWNVSGNSVTHNVLKGRSINSAAMTPSGDLIAVSVGTALNIGQIRDSVYVLRANDKTELFRRYLRRYARTPVYFPTEDLMAYTEERKVVVLRVNH